MHCTCRNVFLGWQTQRAFDEDCKDVVDDDDDDDDVDDDDDDDDDDGNDKWHESFMIATNKTKITRLHRLLLPLPTMLPKAHISIRQAKWECRIDHTSVEV